MVASFIWTSGQTTDSQPYKENSSLTSQGGGSVCDPRTPNTTQSFKDGAVTGEAASTPRHFSKLRSNGNPMIPVPPTTTIAAVSRWICRTPHSSWTPPPSFHSPISTKHIKSSIPCPIYISAEKTTSGSSPPLFILSLALLGCQLRKVWWFLMTLTP